MINQFAKTNTFYADKFNKNDERSQSRDSVMLFLKPKWVHGTYKGPHFKLKYRKTGTINLKLKHQREIQTNLGKVSTVRREELVYIHEKDHNDVTSAIRNHGENKNR